MVGRSVLPITLALIVASPCLRSQEAPTDLEAELNALLNTKVEVASKSAEKISDAPGIISVLTRDDLQRFGGVTLKDVLNRVPGLISVTSYLAERNMVAASGDNVRFLKASTHVLVLLDGRPVREVQEGGIKSDFYEAFPLDAVDHIEVIKGPGSVLYGSEAFSAVINVVTDKAKATGGSISTGFGQAGSYKHTAKMDVHSGDFALTGAFQRTRRPDWLVQWPNGDVTNPWSPTTMVTPFEQRTQSAGAFLRSSYKGFSFAGSFLRLDIPFMIPDYERNIGDTRLRKAFLDVGYNFVISDKWNITANVTYNRSWFRVLSPGALPPIDRDSHENLGEITSFYAFTPKVRLIVGGLYSKSTGTEQTTGTPPLVTSTGSRPSSALYAQLDVQFVDTFKGIFGFQALKVGDAESSTVPRLGLVWNPTSKINAKLLYGEAFRAPYINENFIDFNNFLRGNKLLKPEKVKSTQLGVSYAGTRGELGFSAFHNKQSDFITFTGVGGTLVYNNQGEATIKGVELEGKLYLNKEFFLVGSLLYQSTPVNSITGLKERTGYSDSGAKLGISYMGTMGSISLFNVHQGSIPSELNNPRTTSPNADTYDLLSLHAKLNLLALFGSSAKAKVELVIEGDNLLDKELWLLSTGDAFPATLPVNKGRNIIVGVKATF